MLTKVRISFAPKRCSAEFFFEGGLMMVSFFVEGNWEMNGNDGSCIGFGK